MTTKTAKTAPYGSWKSPITSDLIVAQSISLSEVRLDGGTIYWLEGRPQEQGRIVVVRAGASGEPDGPHAAPFNVRTRVHEYGGGAWTVTGRHGLLLRLRGRPAVPAGRRRRRAGAAHARPSARRARLAICRRHHRPSAQSLDRRARGSHRRRRAGQRDRRRRSRAARRRARTRAGRAGTTSSPRRGCRRTGAGSSGSPGIIPTCRGTAPRSTSPTLDADGAVVGEPAVDRRRPGGIDLPAGMVARRRARSSSCPTGPAGGTSTASISRRERLRPLAPMAAEFGAAAMGVRHVDLCLCRARSHRLHLFAGGPRAAGAARSCDRRAAHDRHAVHANSARCAPPAIGSCSSPARPTVPTSIVDARSRAPAGTAC